MLLSDITQTTAHYWNVIHRHKWFVAAQLSNASTKYE